MKYNEKIVKKAIEIYIKKRGNKSAVCRALNIERKTIDNWIEKYPEFAEKIKWADEELLDNIESCLDRNCFNGDQRAIEYKLNNKGKSRGYGKPNEINITGEVKNKIQLDALSEEELLVLSKLSITQVEDDA